MKRVLFTAGLLGSAAIIVCACLPCKFALYLSIAVFAALLVVLLFAGNHKWKLPVVVCLAITCVLIARFYVTTMQGPKASQILVGKTVAVTGYVTQEPEYKDGCYIYSVTTKQVAHPSAPQRLNLRFCLSNKHLNAFDEFEAEVKFYELDDDYKKSNYSNGVYLSAFPKQITKTGLAKKSFNSFACDIRVKVRACITKSLSKEVSGILVGLLTNGSSYLDDETYSAFKTCGLSHMIAVSGMHMVMVSNSVMLLLALFGVSKRIRFFLCLPFLLLYVAISGFSASAIRSVIMIAAIFLGDFLYRRNDGLNTLGATALGMLLVFPFLIYDLSFLLSFSAMAGILLIAPLQNKLNSKITISGPAGNFLKYLIALTVSTLAANLATFPIVLLVWQGASTVTVFANLAISFVMHSALIFGIIVVALALLLGKNIFTDILFKMIEFLLYYVRSAAIAISNIPNSYILLNVPRFSLICSAALGASAVVLFIKEIKKGMGDSGG